MQYVLQCTDDAYEKLQKTVDDVAATLPGERKEASSKPDCPSLALPAVDYTACYVTEYCGHFYCTVCAQDLVKNALANSNIPICCAHEACNQSLVLQDFRNLGLDLNALSEVGLRVFMLANTKAFGYCPTANCPMIYKKCSEEEEDDMRLTFTRAIKHAEERVKFVCSVCGSAHCTRCMVC